MNLNNDNSRGTNNSINQVKFKNSMLKSSLYVCSDSYIHIKGTMTIPKKGTTAAPNNRNKK